MSKPVLVVGAGPVGLTMAAELARYGVSVRIIEQNAPRTDKSKALAVWARTLELLDRAGCAGDFAATEATHLWAGKLFVATKEPQWHRASARV